MSYILDALRKAESERQLGALPNVHTPGAETARQHSLRGPMLAIVVLLLVIVVLLVWRNFGQSGAPAPVPVTPGVPVAAVADARALASNPTIISPPASNPTAINPTAATAPAANPTLASAPVTGALATNPAMAASPAAAKAHEPVPATPPVKPVQLARAAGLETAAPSASTKRAQDGVANPQSTPAAPVSIPPKNVAGAGAQPINEADAADEALPLMSQLPEAIVREVPPIAVKGYIYSKNPADRILIIGGNFHHEGDELSSGVRLEKLLPKAAVLSYKGFRYRLAY